MTVLSFIVMFPAITLTCTLLVLVGLYYYIAFGGRITIITLCLLALAPLWPILLLRLIAVSVVDLCDWILEKPWTRPFVMAAHNLERRL